MECVFKPGQTYKTRDGREVSVYRSDGSGLFSVRGAIGGVPFRWRNDGAYHMKRGSPCDLMPPAPPRIREKVWVAIYSDGQMYMYKSELNARSMPRGGLLRIVPCLLIEIVDGEPGV